MRLALLVVLLFTCVVANGQWQREVVLESAYMSEERDHHGRPEWEYYLFYANDSVVSFTVGEWEGAFSAWDLGGGTPVAQISQFVSEYHCAPSAAEENGEYVSVYWFAGASMVWGDRFYETAHLSPDGSTLTANGQRFIRIKRWNKVIAPNCMKFN